MTKAQRDGIAELLREHVRLQADIDALETILAMENTTGRVTADWKGDLARLQQSAPYRMVLAEGEKLIAEIEAAITESDLLEVLVKNPTKGRPN